MILLPDKPDVMQWNGVFVVVYFLAHMGTSVEGLQGDSAAAYLHAGSGERGADSVCSAPAVTTSNGAAIDSLTVSMTAGKRGPQVLQDFMLLEELTHFVREKIPARSVHEKGLGAFGDFTVTNNSIAKLTKASLFQRLGKKTDVAVRFSTAGASAGSCDSARDAHGMGIKFYTDDGNFDLLAHSTPMFVINDPKLFVSRVHMGLHPSSHLPDRNMWWDMASQYPPSCHLLMYLFSSRGLPYNKRTTNYYPIHAFKLVNKENEAIYVKFHIKSNQGEQFLDDATSAQICGVDPDFHTRDLYENIQKKNFPSWTLFYQMMTYEQVANLSWNPFDPTKTWPVKNYPWNEIGKLELNRNPKNYFAEVEQLALSPGNLVTGIEPSPDRVLQARLFIYGDAQRYRLGVNYWQLPVNQPKVPVVNSMRDGAATFYNQGDEPNYVPNSDKNYPQACPMAAWNKWSGVGDVDRYDDIDSDPYTQATTYYNEALDDQGRAFVIKTLAAHLSRAKQELQDRAIKMLSNISPDFKTKLPDAIKAVHLPSNITEAIQSIYKCPSQKI